MRRISPRTTIVTAFFAALLVGAPTAQAAPPGNDAFANATVVGLGSTTAGTNVEATGEQGEPIHDTRTPDPAMIDSVWYRYTPASSGPVIINTCAPGAGVDTTLAVYTGSGSPSALQLVGSSDDTCGFRSAVFFNATAGTQYSIAVDGFRDLQGTFELTIQSPALPNDDFASPFVLTGAPTTAHGVNLGATAEAGEPGHAGEPARSSLWYRWQAPADGEYAFEVCGDFVNRMTIYTGTALTALTKREASRSAGAPEANGCFTSAAELTANGGTTYRIVVDGVTAGQTTDQAGGYDLAIGEAGIPPVNDDFADAIPLTLGTILTGGTNIGATKEPGEPNHDANAAGHSVWYSFDPPDADRVAVDSCASDIATVAGVYTGSAVNGLSTVATGDGCRGAIWIPDPAKIYYVAIDAAANDLGGDTGDLEVSVVDEPVPVIPPTEPPTEPPTTPVNPGQPEPDTKPPVVKVDSGPTPKTWKKSAKLAFSAGEPVKFECRLTGKKAKKSLANWVPCSSETKYKKLKPGKYRFEVRGYDAALNVSETASWAWKVIPK